MQLQPRHFPFALAFLCGAAGGIALQLLHSKAAAVGGPCAFFVVYLVFTAIRIPKLTAAYLKANAARTDEPVWIIFLITTGTVVVAIGCLFILLNQGVDPATGEKVPPDSLDLLLSLATVALGWFTIHTMAALHYAHLFWRPNEDGNKTDAHRGLEFPGDTEPGAHDFLYFAFVVGMTAQTSDVQITTTAMRKFNLLHGIVSFLFNTVLVAAVVNVVVSLAS